MIDLKLAEYHITSKKEGESTNTLTTTLKNFPNGEVSCRFKRFIPLASGINAFGHCFRYMGDTIDIIFNGCVKIRRDETDPLGRFKGLFDDRTYADGRFVLIRKFKNFNEDDILKVRYFGLSNKPLYDIVSIKDDQIYIGQHQNNFCRIEENLGNIHKQPEYNKILESYQNYQL